MAGDSVPSGAATDHSPRSYAGVIALIALGQVIIAIDFCGTSVALPSIARDLGAPANMLSWIATSFALVYAGGLILCGRLADSYGHRRFCILGLVLFGLGSLGAAVSSSMPMLLACRAVEGLGGACLTPTSFSLINVLLPEGRVRHFAFSVFGVTQGLSYVVGLYGGGALVSAFGWRSAYLMNFPAIAAAVWLAWRCIPARAAVRAAPRVDFSGAFLVTSAIGLLMFALTAAERFGWASFATLAALGGGVLSLGLLVVVESTIRNPLIPPALLRTRNVAGGDLGTIFMVAASASTFVLLSLYMQRLLHFSPVNAGLGMLPNSLAVVVGGQLAGRGMTRLRASIVSGFAAYLVGAVFVGIASPSWGYAVALLPAMLVIGAGSTIANLGLMALATADVPHTDQNLASAVLMTAQQIGVALGISIVFAVLASAGDPATAFRHAFLAAAALAGLALAAALTLTRSRPTENMQPALTTEVVP